MPYGVDFRELNMKYIMLLLCISMLACSDTTLTGPSLPGGGDGTIPPIETGKDPTGHMIDMNNLWGFSAFRMPETPEEQQRHDFRFARRHGYTIARVCAETLEWTGRGGLVPGSPLPEALTRITRTIDIADREGMSVLVMGLCTIRDVGGKGRRDRFIHQLKLILRGKTNVAVEAVNEPWHPRSKVTSSVLDKYILKFRSLGIPAGADQHLGSPNGRYVYNESARSTFPSFHVWRFPGDPRQEDLRAIVSQNNGWALISESIALGTEADVQEFGHLVTSSKPRVQALMSRCVTVRGCYLVAHTMEGLRGDRLTWLPTVR